MILNFILDPGVPMSGRSRRAALCVAAVALSLTGGCRSGRPIPPLQPPPAPAAAGIQATPPGGGAGVLVMAHGGDAEWNAHVSASLSELGGRMPVAVAFGMADPGTLQAALDELEAREAGTIAVVRLFLSRASFLHQTEFLFGLRPDPPARAMMGHRMVAGSELSRLETNARILLDTAGLAGSEQVTGIVLERADASSPDPAATGVLLIAHGMGSEDRNGRLLDAMEASARELRSRGYGEVRVATLREDWAEARARAERDIRAAVGRMGERWGSVVVVPYRVYGFGPYAEVLQGLDYVGTQGLLPHDLVAAWVAARSAEVLCAAGLVPAPDACPPMREPAPR